VHTAGGVRWHELTARACLDPASGHPSILVSETDVSELKEAEARARHMAHRDPLTGLPNRLALPAVFEKLRGRALKTSSRFQVFFIDLDKFKAINDTLGHQEGDALLKRVANFLSELCGKDDAAIRLGGDEFLVLASEEQNEAGRLAEFAERMLEGL